MDISVVIVNYNVKHFLEQCLHSVYNAVKGLSVEIFVVDNNSVDGSCAAIREKFPKVHLIENRQNAGFSKANNQAITKAKGTYVLLLNPDTVVQENTLVMCHSFMKNHPNAGAMGVKMIDGKGNFLPESKRALPTPDVAFFKIFGLSKLFPKSKTFNRYHLGYLDENQTNEIEVLPGAFMFIRKSVLDNIGLLDESFFMYGEDIDLSYRIVKAGHKIYYYPETTIIHYKGESTKKGSINYVLVFYRAMIIFARKHFARRKANAYILLIKLAIYFRAGLSLLKRFINNIIVALLEIFLIFGGFYALKPFWEQYKFGEKGYYPEIYLQVVVPLYIFVWMISSYFLKAYKKPMRPAQSAKGILTGTVIILVVYALLPENLRFSRALILLGTAWAITVSLLLRYVFHLINYAGVPVKFYSDKKKIVIAGSIEEVDRIRDILQQTNIKSELAGMVSPEEEYDRSKYLGNISHLPEIIKILRIDEIIFSSKNMSSEDIIRNMLKLSTYPIDFKIAPPESLSIIGSNSINTAGELYTVNLDSIGSPVNKRKKRFFDMVSSVILLLLSPVLLLIQKKPGGYFQNTALVLFGKYSWIGYSKQFSQASQLPRIKPGIFIPSSTTNPAITGESMEKKLNILYAKDYKISRDVSVMLRNLTFIGGR